MGRPTQRAADVLSLFGARRVETPDAPAVVDDDSKRAYAELAAESDAYAARLSANGAGPETVVPVVARRSPQYVAMILGVLKTGAAFVPVEPETPTRRGREIVAAAGPPVLLVQPGHEEYAAELAEPGRASSARVVSAVATTAGDPTVCARPRQAAGLAYVIFTSGSTGTPKGAMVVDAGMDNHMLAKRLDFVLGPSDVVGFTAPLSFDISVWQALTALTVGGCVAVASPLNISEPVELVAWVRRHGVTVLEIVPSFMAVLLDELAADESLRSSLGTLRLLVATGEALPARLARRWLELCPEIALANAYGPTECSDDVTHHFVTAADCAGGRRPPIGREIVNVRINVIDSDGKEVGTSEEGELLVGGACVGRGYLGDPVRTALAFVPDYLSQGRGARLYRTGDRGSRAADGTIDFVGRRDRQVKVRGHRVELGDVEAQLLRVPEVASAACVFAEGRLHAFVTLHTGADGRAPGDGVLETVPASAPAYLVPHHLTVLERIPTRPSGKIDHDELERRSQARGAGPPAADGERGDGASTLAAVCALVAEVLELPSVAPDDDFFAAGGDSLQAMSLLSLARKRFEATDAELRGFLADPTPRGLLSALEAAKANARTGRRSPVHETEPGALSSGQERLWFLEQLHPRRGPQLIRLGLSLHGPLDVRALEHAVDAVVARHEPLRTVFSQEHGIPVAHVWPRVDVALERVVASERDLVPMLLDGSGLTARTEEPPLMTVRLARLAPDHHLLAVLMHHLVSDGFSLLVLGQDIGTYYRRWLDGDASVPLPDTTFSRYVAEERRWLAGPEAVDCERFWSEQLADAPRAIKLPLDRPAPVRPDFTASCVVAELTPRETALVGDVARALKATPFMAATAALYAALRELTGSHDFVIGIDSINRSWPGSEQLIGTFVNQLPVRFTSSPADATFGEVLELVRRRCLAAYENDRLPFHKIVAAVNPPRRAGRSPLFQVKITHQGAWRTALTLPGIEVAPSEISEPATDLDLLLDVSGETSRLRLELVYRPEVLDEATAAAWVDAIAGILRTGAADPGALLASPSGAWKDRRDVVVEGRERSPAGAEARRA